MPAAAVIPAPTAYIKVVAVKKLVAELLLKMLGPPSGREPCLTWHLLGGPLLHFTAWRGVQGFYFEEIRVFLAGIGLEYASME